MTIPAGHEKAAAGFRIAAFFCALATLEMLFSSWVSFHGVPHEQQPPHRELLAGTITSAALLVGATVLSLRRRRLAGLLICAAYAATAFSFYLATQVLVSPSLMMLAAMVALAITGFRRSSSSGDPERL